MTSLDKHPYRPFLQDVAKPGRYVGGEYHQIRKDPAQVQLSLALAFPDIYDIGMSHLGSKILYQLINAQEDLLCERVFAPWPDMEEQLRTRKLPLLSLENHRPLSDFEVVGFSLQYELTFTSVLNMLDLSGIPLHSDARGEQDPLILAGGPIATQPEPMAPFIDAFLIGDAEELLPELLRRHARDLREGLSRRERLISLARMDGIYCPSLYSTGIDPVSGLEVVDAPLAEEIPGRPRRIILEDLDRFPYPDASPVAATETVFDRLSVEIARGCTEGCRFCQAGMIYRPARERNPRDIMDTVLRAVDRCGYDEAGLTTLSTADYSCITPLMNRLIAQLREKNVALSVASLRAYGLSEESLDAMASYRAQGLTFAPEAGSERMRAVINKNIDEEDLRTTAHRVYSRGWKRMKLYFMIGLPTETEEDVREIMELGRRMKEIGHQYHGRRTGLTVSVSSHVPKPHTPFQWAPMDSMETLAAKQDQLQELARRHRIELRRHDPRRSWLECLIGRGDRRTARLIEEAYRRGARLDGWDEQLNWEAWQDAIEATGLDTAMYLRELPTHGRLPWDHLDMGLHPDFLLEDYQRALRAESLPPCGKPEGVRQHPSTLLPEEESQTLVCHHCGLACNMSRMKRIRREAMEEISSPDPADEDRVREELQRRRGRLQKGAAPHDFHQGDGVRLWLTFHKTGGDALTGHLDMVRSLPRILRRARLPLFYTEGFHPKPALSFSPALPLGMESYGEVVEVKLAEAVDPALALHELNEVRDPGILFTAAHMLPPGEAKLSRSIRAADYLVRLPGLKDEPRIAQLIGDFLDSSSRPVVIQRKKGEKTVNIRPLVEDLRWATDVDLRALPANVRDHLGEYCLFLRLALDGDGQIKPQEVIAELLGEVPADFPQDYRRLGLVMRTPLAGAPPHGGGPPQE